MAEIDKIRATYDQYLAFVKWCNENAPFMLDRIYYKEEYYRQSRDFPLTLVNLPVYLDMFLLFHCDLTFIRDRIFEMYDIPIKYRKDLDEGYLDSWEKEQIIHKIICK